jgi:Uma2 family endonuclease
VALPEYPYIDVEDYLALDNTVKSARYEFIDGTLRMLAGGSPSHSVIANNIAATFHQAFRNKPCVVYNPDVRLRLSTSRYVHPDVTVGCDPRDNEKEDHIEYPRILVEVLSPSTEATDRGEKLNLYLELPTLEIYMLVGSQKKTVEVYQRNDDAWVLRTYKPGDTIYLNSIDVQMTFDDIYAKTNMRDVR